MKVFFQNFHSLSFPYFFVLQKKNNPILLFFFFSLNLQFFSLY